MLTSLPPFHHTSRPMLKAETQSSCESCHRRHPGPSIPEKTLSFPSYLFPQGQPSSRQFPPATAALLNHGCKEAVGDSPGERGLQVKPILLNPSLHQQRRLVNHLLTSKLCRYYQPTNATNSQTPDIALRPQSSSDTALTAFAQLGALRLGARRAFISLVTREHQYFIAEATRTLSLRSDDVFEPTDQLWKGETTGRRNEGPSSVAMDLFTGVIEGNREYLLVSDMLTDDRFCRTEAVSRSPFMKSCVVVPLLSPRGLVIGTFSVVDDKSRDGISSVEIAFMQDIASTIMAHLEAKRLKQQHRRAERMIRGPGLFVEGKSSLREWWLMTGHKTKSQKSLRRLDEARV